MYFKTVISSLQISGVLDYDKDRFRKICKGIQINKLLLYLGSGSHSDRSTKLFGSRKCFYQLLF